VLEKRNVYNIKQDLHKDVIIDEKVDHSQNNHKNFVLKGNFPQSQSEIESIGEYPKLSLINNIQFSSSDSLYALGNQENDFRSNMNSALKFNTNNNNIEKKILTPRSNNGSDIKLESENTDSEKIINEMEDKKTEDYDNRPIKPLDPNLLNKQLSEFSEMSSEEYEQLRIK
jgi:hypothetical protein